ncbi:MAG: hypothetical protein J5760_01105 [Clostridia bacterium]|nr:hypothetical protein [Clostridia bacterium]
MRKKRKENKKLPYLKVSDVASATECTGFEQFACGCVAEEESLRAICDIPHDEEEREDFRRG